MSNFKDIYTWVQKKIKDTSSTTLVEVKDEIHRTVDELLNCGFLRFAFRDYTLTTTSGTTDYYLPSDVDKIISVKQTNTPIQLGRVWIGDFERIAPNPTATGVPTNYTEVCSYNVKAQPSAAAKIIISSNSNQDISGLTGSTIVSLHGVVSDEERTEYVSLSATNVLSSSLSYTTVYSITPDINPVGTLRFTQAVTGTEILNLYPNERIRTYKKFKLYPNPDGAYSIYVKYKACQPKMVYDSDNCIIPKEYFYTVAYKVVAEMLAGQGDARATMYFQLAEKAKRQMIAEQDLYWDEVPEVINETGIYIDSSNPLVK